MKNNIYTLYIMRMSSFEKRDVLNGASPKKDFVIPEPDKNPEAYQYYLEHFFPPKEGGEFKIIGDEKYERKATRWTIKTYFQHPGPGWDFKFRVRDFGFDPFRDLEELPDTPYYDWQFVELIKK